MEERRREWGTCVADPARSLLCLFMCSGSANLGTAPANYPQEMATTGALNAAICAGNLAVVSQSLIAFLQRDVELSTIAELQEAVAAIAGAIVKYPENATGKDTV